MKGGSEGWVPEEPMREERWAWAERTAAFSSSTLVIKGRTRASPSWRTRSVSASTVEANSERTEGSERISTAEEDREERSDEVMFKSVSSYDWEREERANEWSESDKGGEERSRSSSDINFRSSEVIEDFRSVESAESAESAVGKSEVEEEGRGGSDPRESSELSGSSELLESEFSEFGEGELDRNGGVVICLC